MSSRPKLKFSVGDTVHHIDDLTDIGVITSRIWIPSSEDSDACLSDHWNYTVDWQENPDPNEPFLAHALVLIQKSNPCGCDDPLCNICQEHSPDGK